jgi:hypothetical protein
MFLGRQLKRGSIQEGKIVNIYKIQSQLAETLKQSVQMRDQMHAKGISLFAKAVCYVRFVLLSHKIQRLIDRLHADSV